MVKKNYSKFICFLISLCLIASFVPSSYAEAAKVNNNLGKLIYYYEGEGANEIGKWYVTPNVLAYNLGTSIDVTPYVNVARNQWTAAGISTKAATTTIPINPILFYAGTRAQLNSIGFDYTSDTLGYTMLQGYYNGYYTKSSGQEVDSIRIEISLSSICYNSDSTEVSYKKTATHEFGHALGWFGHPLNTTSERRVMEQGLYVSNYTLATDEKNHLVQIYK